MSHEAAQTKTPPALWRESLDEECPITLEPLKLLRYPPFILPNHMYFDGVALAMYITSRGMFENPLTREPLTYADCKRLDDYVRLYHPHDTRMAVCCEAFTLHQSVRVSSRDNRRAQVLRGEAAAALVNLFVYGRHTPTRNVHLPQPRQPEASFHLYDQPTTRSAILEMDGLRIIDDDQARVVQSEQSDWRQIQESFPPLTLSDSTTPAAVGVDEHMLAVARETAASLQREQESHSRLLQQARIRLIQEARMRQEERREAREAAKAVLQAYCQKQRQEQDELEQARAEIEQWRNKHWDKLLEESCQQTEALSIPCEPPLKQVEETIVDRDVEERELQIKRQKAANKRQRQKDRKKEKKYQEQEALKRLEEEERLKKIKAASLKKCAACGDGIVGPGYERFHHFFCSTKCARSETQHPP